ncbi:sensor histidine kinase [Nonomuraea rubra]|uniref:sensor histidine kinase n=1 Tax=Nonomuraea rubra TaxID=46180 RepID=UPI0036142454
MSAQAAGAMLDKAPDKAAAELERVQRLAGEALSELRAVIVELRPAELDRHGLSETLRKHVRLLDRLHPAVVTFECAELPPLGSPVEVAVLRVAQEALHNALRHSRAETVSVRLSYAGGRLELVVRDDGDGFEQAESRGLGLASMRDRAEAVGGELSVESVPGIGTTVRVEVSV